MEGETLLVAVKPRLPSEYVSEKINMKVFIIIFYKFVKQLILISAVKIKIFDLDSQIYKLMDLEFIKK